MKYENFDIVYVGGGIANIMSAIQILKKKPNTKILILEKGNSLEKRVCPKEKTGVCQHCKNCYIFGLGGAGTFSDSKLTYNPEIGGNVIEYIGEKNFNNYLDKADSIFTEFGGVEEFFDDKNDFTNSFEYDCSKYGLKLLRGKVRHLGTDGSQIVMKNILKWFEHFPNLKIICNAPCTNIDFKKKIVTYTCNAERKEKILMKYENHVQAKNIVMGVGRDGSDWLFQLCKDAKINQKNGVVDIGVRVECPAAVTDFVTDKLYEFKVITYSKTNKVRTFCVNPNGYVAQENYEDGTVCVNGHSYLNKKSLNTNFALLVSCRFTEPFDEPIRFGKSICSSTNMLTNGKVMVQRWIDLKAHKRTNKDRLKRISINPTLTDAEPGDLRYALPANVVDSIVSAIENLNNVIPNLAGPNTLLYAPEVKFYSSIIDVNENLELKDYPNIYCIGDGSGITRGIMQSALSGLFVGDRIVKNIENSYKKD